MTRNKNTEINFHNERYKDGDDTRKGFEKFYTITINAQNYFKEQFTKIITKNKYPKVLDYGCGIDAHGFLGTIKNTNHPENIFDFYKKHKMKFYGIDISPEAIRIAKKNQKKIKFNATYEVMDAEKTKYKNNSFDLIFGKGIIHHLSYNNCLPELARLINEEGSCLFFEPLHHHPIIRLGRFFTPTKRTVDEHPIKSSDLIKFKKYFTEVNYKSFCLTNLAAFIFYRTPLFKTMLNFFNMFDNYLFKNFPFLRKYGWIVVLELKKPSK